ncbi:MAG: uroporphyrinogen decarboxylase family protein [Anaerolineaceae bacterium]|nr:uroporphyrinogen decarboxylase family protein [Anaerolineaceae bacterium]
MNSRERVHLALNHQEADRIPLDLGAAPTTGMHVSSVYRLRQALQLDPPGTPVKVIEPYQMLGEIAADLIAALGVDVVGLWPPTNLFGFRNDGWKPWISFDGTPVLVPEAFNTEPEEDGSLLMYPQGDHSAPPSGKMPAGGFYFDSLPHPALPEDYPLDVEENLQEFGPVSNEDLNYFATQAERLYTQTDKAILVNFGNTAFGDIALVPAPWMKNPRGIRNIEEWYISTVSRKEYVYRIFERQCAIALENLPRLYQAVGERITAVFMSGTDFGMQTGSFISPKAYRDLYKPFQKQLNDWVHQHTSWKCFIHSCGSIVNLMPDMIEAGFDIFNPVQTSAAGMDPHILKARFGNQVTFWGGGVDTQHVLPFGSPDEIRTQVCERIHIFGQGGGFVFNPSHNVQAGVPVENLLAMYQAVMYSR